MKKKFLVTVLIGTLSVSVLSGCQNSSSQTEEDVSVSVQEEAEVEYKTIGEETEDAYAVILTNTTGQDIKSVSIKSSSEEKYPDNMLEKDDLFEKDETRVMYYEPAKEEEQATDTGKELPPEYSVQLTLADDTTVELHAFPFEEAEKSEGCEIKLQDGVVFITYECDGEAVSTLDAELAVKAQKEAEEKAAADAAAKAAAEKEAADAAAADAAAQQYVEPVYEEPVYEAPVYEEPAGDDGCVGDGLTY